ncbi:MAG: 50S ribosomal protein L10 [Dehalococcoidia bacterium]
MATEKKIETVQELRERIERCTIAIAADYRGLSVPDMARLRQAIREADVEMRVVKNRLFLRAADEAGRPVMAELLEGPTAIIFGYDDIVAPAKVVAEYMRTARNTFAVRKGVMNTQVLSLIELQDLASLPPREILAGQIAGALQAPIARLSGLMNNLMPTAPVRLLNDTMHTLAGLLDARSRQLEGA